LPEAASRAEWKAAAACIKRLEPAAERRKDLVRQSPDRAKRMIRRNTFLQPHETEKLFTMTQSSAHQSTPENQCKQ
jgi:hypothetical protein